MLTSVRSLAAASVFSFVAVVSAPASAQVTNPADEVEDDSSFGIDFSANAAITSEYRFRGIDLSGGDIAIQGGIDLGLPAGFYVGTWGSSLDEDTVGYGHTELDIYGGWTGDLGIVSADVGVIAYLYPNAGPGEYDYYEGYASVGAALGPAEATLGFAYAPEQDSLGGTDNVYVYGDLGFGLPGTPVSLSAHLGYTDGFLTYTPDGKAFDWSVAAEMAIPSTPLSVSVAYVGAEGDPVLLDDAGTPAVFTDDFVYDFTDDALVVTLSASF
ncbi:hypothetical protein GRI62_01930 [Erythrobacter arachoides]|uniref:Porin n=1 Tax=Aurantiacibacter arachoides TaxID=1850444 RepID=A0A844ZY25_9SPHN|nr:TorF family putative porin [Aurantiacibacter arachoides]MXO92364.1 hypothetical protein [Aurantiacibacter arachoides]GGD57743.1 hypothetical protein GCM10011411_17250 [Aurantiacibacter arachoides]